jgi:hypothetical protein
MSREFHDTSCQRHAWEKPGFLGNPSLGMAVVLTFAHEPPAIDPSGASFVKAWGCAGVAILPATASTSTRRACSDD